MTQTSKQSVKSIWASIVLAGGDGRRSALPYPKQYSPLPHHSNVLAEACKAFLDCPQVAIVLPVIAAQHQKLYDKSMRDLLANPKLLPATIGGSNRQMSVLHGLQALLKHDSPPDYVLIHDAARPFVSSHLISKVMQACSKNVSVIPALPSQDSACLQKDGYVDAYLPRQQLRLVQTPQAFPFAAILKAHENACKDSYNDDAALISQIGMQIKIIQGEPQNRKLTNPQDFAPQAYEFRSANGFDVHRFTTGDSVRLCGVDIPHTKRLVGHSDADVALHALCDAMLALAGSGDIGTCFPPSDPQWKNADSTIFIEYALKKLQKQDIILTYADITLICEEPKIAPHRNAMLKRLAGLLQIEPTRIGLKATTTERLGFLGDRQGIAALTHVTVKTLSKNQ